MIENKKPGGRLPTLVPLIPLYWEGCGLAKVDTVKMVAEIDLKENAVYRVIDGKLEKVDKPGNGFGKQTITWQNGKPTHYEVSYTVK